VDLGISGRWAVVCASSQGLGRACAQALLAEGVNVVVNGRTADKLHAVAAELRAAPDCRGEVVAAAADITTPEGRAALLAAAPTVDILVTNNVGPKPGTIADITEDDLDEALRLHFHAPIALVKAVLPAMKAQGFGRIVNITSAMVKRPSSYMIASAGARAGQSAVMKAVSVEVARFNVTINNLLPERIDTPRQDFMAKREVDQLGITYDEARQRQSDSIAAKRLGLPSEFGAACAFLCSAQASFISGVHLHLDGGSYPGLV
jgi:3-oxoacyl-[acyl-carrier protein] reductase